MLLTARTATAGEVHFELGRHGETLHLTLRSQETVFFPRVHVLGQAGQWWPVYAAGDDTQIEPDTTLRAAVTADLIDRLHAAAALRISFRDRAGAEHVQFGTTHPWPALERPPAVQRRDGALWVDAPEPSVTTTWVLGPDNSGLVSPPVHNAAEPAPAWAVPLRWAAGDRAPLAAPLAAPNGPWLLLHESTTAGGLVFRLQTVMDLSRQTDPRPRWLEATSDWAVALCALAMAAWLSWPRRRTKGSGQNAHQPGRNRQ